MENLLSEIKSLYGLDLHSPEKIERGYLSENHVLTDSATKYFLKRYRFDREEKVAEVHAAKRYFSDGGIPVILPLPNKNGKTFFSYEGGYFAIFPFIDGRHIQRESLTEAAAVSMGKMLGKIHLLGMKSPLSAEDHFSGWDKEKFLAKADLIISIINEKAELDDFDKKALQTIQLRRQLIEENTINFEDLGLSSNCLIHGDYHEMNMFFDDNDNVEYVFDWEKITIAPRMFELMRSVIYVFFGDSFDEKSIHLARTYINAYTSVVPTSEEELTKGLQLFYLRQLHGFWVENEHYLKNNYRVDRFLISRSDSTKYMAEHLDELTKKLIG